MSDKIVTLDVREDVRRGEQVFPRIMQVVAALRDGEGLRLIAPFSPLPLLTIMEAVLHLPVEPPARPRRAGAIH